MRTLILSLLLAAPFAAVQARPQASAPAESAAPDFTETWRAVLATRRAAQITLLRGYAEAGLFPVNTTTPGLQSQLLDERGNPCAMAYLVIASGRGDLIERLARHDNDLRFGDVTDGPVLEWVLTSGLTQEEAAFVQVPDFFVDDRLEPERQEILAAAEIARLSSHSVAAAAQLEAYGDTSLEVALGRLGDRVHTPPPASVAGL